MPATQLQLLLLPLLLLQLLMLQLSDARTDGEARTECIAHCFNHFRNNVHGKLGRKLKNKPELISTECTKSVRKLKPRGNGIARLLCNGCVKTCNNYKTPLFPQRSCTKFCDVQDYGANHIAKDNCLKACKNLSNLFNTNQGTCTQHQQQLQHSAAGAYPLQQAACRSSVKTDCDNNASAGPDSMCASSEKCCLTNCGMRCVSAIISDSLLPDTPEKPKIKRINNKIIRLSWNDYKNKIRKFKYPIVFLVQYREEADNYARNKWLDSSFSSKTEINFQTQDDPVQFRIMATSIHGFRDYSPASDLIDAAACEVRNFQHGTQQLDSKSVAMELFWDSPTQTGVHLHNFTLEWAQILDGTTVSYVSRRAFILPTVQSYWLNSLQPNSNYQITIRATCSIGSQLVHSPEVTVKVPTLVIRQSAELASNGLNAESPNDKANAPSDSTDCSCVKPPTTKLMTGTSELDSECKLSIKVKWTALFNHRKYNKIKRDVSEYKLEWSEKVCIESDNAQGGSNSVIIDRKETSYKMTKLKFKCHYSLSLTGLLPNGDSAFQWKSCFCTAGRLDPGILRQSAVCNNYQEVRFAYPPKSVQVKIAKRFVNRSHRNSALVEWTVADKSSPIQGFRVKWGPRRLEAVDPYSYSDRLRPKMDEQRSFTEILDPSQTKLWIRNLNPGIVYVVSVQCITLLADSAEKSTFFTMPGYPGQTKRVYELQKYILAGNAADAKLGAQPAACVVLLLLAHWLAAL